MSNFGIAPSFDFERNEDAIAKEAAVDGFYIIRSGGVSRDEMQSGELARKSHTAELALTLQPIFADASSIRLHFFHCKLRLSSPFSTEFHFPFSPLPP